MRERLPHFVDGSYVAFSNPLAAPLHQLGLELVMAGAFVLTLRHALGCYRRGDRYPLFQWLVILVYGIFMELIAFNFYQNYDHARFSVQLYHGKLPLYVTFCYVVLHYTGLKTIERLALGPVAEALLVGLAICLLDVPFDLAGPDARWWAWSTSDRNLTARWLGVPVTSYYWYLTFGAIYALLCRALRRRVAPRALAVYAALAPLVAAAIIVLGMIAFVPFHLLCALGVPAGAIVAAHAIGCVAVAGARWPAHAAATPRELALVALGLSGYDVGVIALIAARGQVADAPAKLAMATAAWAGSLVLAGVTARGYWLSTRVSTTSCTLGSTSERKLNPVASSIERTETR
jgi:hypothetical protein